MNTKAIRHITHIGYGFYVTNDEYRTLGNKRQSFLTNQYTLPISPFDAENTDYFFGIKMASVVEGQGFCLPSRWNIPDETIESMITNFKTYFTRNVYECHDYVLSELIK